MSTAAVQKMDVNPVEEMLLAEQQLAAAWETYKQAEPHGIAFGKVLCEWRDRFGAQGSRKGGGLRPILDKVGIPTSTAYFWMDSYEVSAGLKQAKEKPAEPTTTSWSPIAPPPPEPRIPMSARIAPERMVRLRVAAEAQGKSVEDVVGELVDEYLSRPDVCKSIEILDALKPESVASLDSEQPYDGQPKVEVDAGELKKALKRLTAVLHNINTPQHVRITSPGGRATLTAVAYDEELTIALSEARTFGDFNLIVLHELLSAATKNLTGTFTIMADGTLQSGGFSSKLACVDSNAGELLRVRDVLPPLQSITVDLAEIKEQYRRVEFAVKPDGKFVVSSALLESTADTFRLVATDGVRLAVSSIPANLGEFRFVVPKPALERLNGMNGKRLSIAETETQFVFSTELETMTYGKSKGEFPAYHRVLPLNHDGWTKITADAGVLASALKRLRPHATNHATDATVRGVRFTIADGVLRLDALEKLNTADGSVFRVTASESVKASVKGRPASAAIDIELLLPFLQQARGILEFYVRDGRSTVDWFAADGYRFVLRPMLGPCATPTKACSLVFPDDEPGFAAELVVKEPEINSSPAPPPIELTTPQNNAEPVIESVT